MNRPDAVDRQCAVDGHRYMGIVRTTYLIGPAGTVQKRCDNVKVDKDAAEV